MVGDTSSSEPPDCLTIFLFNEIFKQRQFTMRSLLICIYIYKEYIQIRQMSCQCFSCAEEYLIKQIENAHPYQIWIWEIHHIIMFPSLLNLNVDMPLHKMKPLFKTQIAITSIQNQSSGRRKRENVVYQIDCNIGS